MYVMACVLSDLSAGLSPRSQPDENRSEANEDQFSSCWPALSHTHAAVKKVSKQTCGPASRSDGGDIYPLVAVFGCTRLIRPTVCGAGETQN